MNQDIIEIEQLIYRCCRAVDQGATDDLMDIFHANGIMRVTWEDNGVYEGQEAIGNWFENYYKTVRTSLGFLRHKVTCPFIKVGGNEAEALSYLDVDAGDRATGRIIITMGRYEDKFVKEDGRWRLKEKAVSIDGTYQYSP